MSTKLQSAIAAIKADLIKWRLRQIGPRARVWHMQDRLLVPHRWIGPNKLYMGSYSPTGQMDPETSLSRRYHPLIQHRMGQAHKNIPKPVETLERAIFAGPLFPAYGHFLLESLARLWAAPRYPNYPLVWSCQPTDVAPSLLPWMHEILAMLGLSNPIKLINHPIGVGHLIVPAPGYEIQYRFGHTHSKFLARNCWKPESGSKLWLSRAGVEKQHGTGRNELEVALIADGWRIIKPETMSINAQMDAFTRAERIAGEQGSALHSLIFMQPAKGLRLDVFARDPRSGGHFVNANQETICLRRQIDYRLHRMDEETVFDQSGSRISKRFGPPAAYLDRLAQW